MGALSAPIGTPSNRSFDVLCQRYRYYVSRPLIIGAQGDGAGLRIPAAEIEQIVTNRIRR